MRLEVLDQKRKDFLKKLGFLRKSGFYLAGGTALALHIGHRNSFDFDFYSKKSFKNEKLKEEFIQRFKKVKEVNSEEDTLELSVDGIRMSFFKYPYKLIKPCLKIGEIETASLEDIAAMKIVAILGRGVKRDFIDIYFLLKTFSLGDIIKFTKKKYAHFNSYTALKGLTYFVDAEKKQDREINLFQKASWEGIKQNLIKEVKKYQENA